MSAPDVARLLHLVDRAERGSLLAEEAVLLRAGIRALGASAAQALRQEQDPIPAPQARGSR